jgi:hypothetical protein
LFRKQGSAVVHQNGPIEIRAGSRCLIYREILFLSFSSSLREIVTHRFDVDSPRFRAESSSRPIDGKTEKKRGGRKEGEERERERDISGRVKNRMQHDGCADEHYRPGREIKSTSAISFEIDAIGVIVIIVNHPTGNCDYVA